jgi:hypothetical protein
MARDDAVMVHLDVDDFGLISGECAERPDVGWRLRDHHITGVDKDPCY